MIHKDMDRAHPESSSPSAPYPSPIPNRNVTAPVESRSHETISKRPTPKPSDYPVPKLRVHVENASHEAVAHLLSNINITELLEDAVRTVLKLLYPTYKQDSCEAYHSKHVHWQEVRSITLRLLEHPGVAETSGIALDYAHKEVKLNLDYVRTVWHKFVKSAAQSLSEESYAPTTPKGIANFKHEVTGVVVHEFVHCYQWSGHAKKDSMQSQAGRAPGGLIEGIADWVRLKAGLGAQHWKPPSQSNPIDYEWNVGYERTAFFLQWLENDFGSDSVVRINAALDGPYEEHSFWKDLFGKTIKELWLDYKTQVESETFHPFVKVD